MSDCLLPTTTSCPVSKSTNHILIVTAGTQNGRDLIEATAEECKATRRNVEKMESIKLTHLYVLCHDKLFTEYCKQELQQDGKISTWDKFVNRMKENLCEILGDSSITIRIQKVVGRDAENTDKNRIDNYLKNIRNSFRKYPCRFYVDVTSGVQSMISSIIMIATWMGWKIYSRSEDGKLDEMYLPPINERFTQPLEEEEALEELANIRKLLKTYNFGNTENVITISSVLDAMEKGYDSIRNRILLDEHVKILKALHCGSLDTINTAIEINARIVDALSEDRKSVLQHASSQEMLKTHLNEMGNLSEDGDSWQIENGNLKIWEDKHRTGNFRKWYDILTLLNTLPEIDVDKTKKFIETLNAERGKTPIVEFDRMLISLQKREIDNKKEKQFVMNILKLPTSKRQNIFGEIGQKNLDNLLSILEEYIPKDEQADMGGEETKKRTGKLKKVTGKDLPSIPKEYTARRILNILYKLYDPDKSINNIPKILLLSHPEYGKTNVASRVSDILKEAYNQSFPFYFIKKKSQNNGEDEVENPYLIEGLEHSGDDGTEKYYKLTNKGYMIAGILSY